MMSMNELTTVQNEAADAPQADHSHDDGRFDREHQEEHARTERLMAENQDLLAAERRRSHQLALVAEVTRKVASLLDLDQVLSETVELVSGSFGTDQVSIHL